MFEAHAHELAPDAGCATSFSWEKALASIVGHCRGPMTRKPRLRAASAQGGREGAPAGVPVDAAFLHEHVEGLAEWWVG